MSLTVTMVPRQYQHLEYRNAMKFLGKAVEKSNGRWTVAEMLHAFASGMLQLWLAYDEDRQVRAAGATKLQEYPNGTMLEVVFLGGEGIKEWFDDGMAKFQQFAKDAGCMGIECVGRHGFWSELKKHGFTKPETKYELMFERDEQ